MKELLKKLDEALEATKDFNKLKHIFSKDDGVKTLAKLRETVGKIKFKVLASQIKEFGFPEGKPVRETRDSGKMVKIRPCSDEYENKTFLGVYIGDAAISSSISITNEALVCSWSHFNPAILIPDSGKIVYGIESWWGLIETEEDLQSITDIDVENIWYVKALKQLKQKDQDKRIPICGKKEHIGWCCDEKGCYPF